jgi:hypothetical protein
MSNIPVETDKIHQTLMFTDVAMAVGQHASLGDGWTRFIRATSVKMTTEHFRPPRPSAEQLDLF